MSSTSRLLTTLVLLLAVATPVAAQTGSGVDYDGSLDSLDEIIAFATSLGEPIGGEGSDDLSEFVETPIAGGTPLPGPSRMWTSSAYISGVPIETVAPTTIGQSAPGAILSSPAPNYDYYGTDGSWVAYNIAVDIGTDWQQTWPFLEIGVGLSKPGLAGAVAPPEIDNDPFEGAERTNTMAWVQGQQQTITGFAQDGPGLNLFQSAYVTSFTHVGGGIYTFTTLIPDPTYTPNFVVSWGDGTDIGSVGFISIKGEPLGTQDPVLEGDSTVGPAIDEFNTFIASLSETESPDPTESSSEDAAASGDDGDAGGASDVDETPPDESSAPIVLIIGGFVVVIVIIGGIAWYFWGNRGEGTRTVAPTAGEDRTKGELSSLKEGVDVPLDVAHLLSEVRYKGRPPGAPMNAFESLLTRAEATGLPNIDGWQLLEFDMAYEYLRSRERTIYAAGPGERTRVVSVWESVAPPDVPIDGNQIGIWYDPEEGLRVGTPTDPLGLTTPPEHAVRPPRAPADEDEAPESDEPAEAETGVETEVKPFLEGDSGSPIA